MHTVVKVLGVVQMCSQCVNSDVARYLTETLVMHLHLLRLF